MITATCGKQENIKKTNYDYMVTHLNLQILLQYEQGFVGRFKLIYTNIEKSNAHKYGQVITNIR